MAGDLQGLLNLKELGGQGQGDVNLVGGGQDVLDVLVVDADGAAGLEVALAHHGSLGVQHGAAGQAAPDGVIDLHGIHTGLGGQHQGLGHGGNVQVDHDLVGQLGDAAGAGAADQQGAAAHDLKHGFEPVEVRLVAAAHNGQSAGDGAGLAAGDGSIHKAHADFLETAVALLRLTGGDAGHVAHHLAGGQRGGHAVLAEQHLPDDGAGGQDRNNEIALPGNVRIAAGRGAHIAQLLDQRLVEIADHQILSCLYQIRRHGATHNAQTNETDLAHKTILL